MQRVCFLLRVRPDRLDEYRARHRDVWPAMLAALRQSGCRNYSLFLSRDGLPSAISNVTTSQPFSTRWSTTK